MDDGDGDDVCLLARRNKSLAESNSREKETPMKLLAKYDALKYLLVRVEFSSASCSASSSASVRSSELASEQAFQARSK